MLGTTESSWNNEDQGLPVLLHFYLQATALVQLEIVDMGWALSHPVSLEFADSWLSQHLQCGSGGPPHTETSDLVL